MPRTCMENLVKFGEIGGAVSQICECTQPQTNRQTDRHAHNENASHP